MNQNFLDENNLDEYNQVRGGAAAFYEKRRGLVAVWGKEAIQFLNGLITNDVAKLEENAQMRAAFPNAQGRLLATVRVLRHGDKFLFETEAETREKVFQNLFRFTFAGDFYVEDLSDDFRCFEVFNYQSENSDLIEFQINFNRIVFVPNQAAENFLSELDKVNAIKISENLYEVLRIEQGIPKYAVDADESTIVPELGIEDLISYQKGCYIGQEIIARIHFRGHVAKQLTGLILEAEATLGDELKSADGKNAGRITSVTFSPKLEKFIALAFVRWDYLAEGTELKINEMTATVKNLPFIE
jgi:folate-binding protein YgfZ